MNTQTLFIAFAVVTLVSPVVLFLISTLVALSGSPNREREISKGTLVCISFGFLAAIGVAGTMVYSGHPVEALDLGDWIAIHEENFHFYVVFIFDRLSVPFLIVTYLLCGTVGAFTTQYLHREPGFNRFFLLYSLFTLGMVVSTLAGTIEVLFFGWELVGLSSALLVGFFHSREAPVINGFRVWIIYRIADAAFLMAAVALHHSTGDGGMQQMIGVAAWPNVESVLNSRQAFSVGILLVIAAAGKSALIPFSGWLPRAMEGPTASSAIFYGALSVHLGAYLLLRVSPLIAASTGLAVVVVVLGLSTALFASIAERVQSDIKSALAFASLTQVGLIVAEIGMGWQYLALVHLLGHAMMRTLQMLRAPSLLRDYFKLETALGHRIASTEQPRILSLFPRLRNSIYRFGLERGYFDAMLNNWVAAPFVSVFCHCSKWESNWIALWGAWFDRSRNDEDEKMTSNLTIAAEGTECRDSSSRTPQTRTTQTTQIDEEACDV